MRGLDRLAEIRRQRMQPSGSVLLYPVGQRRPRQPYEGTLLCDAGDTPALQDLRPLVGLDVIVIGQTGRFDEAEAWARAAIRANANSVGIAIAVPPEQGHIDGPVWIRVNRETIA